MPTDLNGYRRVLLFGGSFDPPHRAHLALPQQAAHAISADLIAYIPAGRAPHKLDRVQTDPHHRLSMLEHALADAPGGITTTIVTDEIKRGPDHPSYTVDTLEALREHTNATTELRLLIGADQVRIFDQWRDHERVIALAEPVVMVRPPDTRESLLSSLTPGDRDTWAGRLVDVDAIDLSSTQLRERFQRGEPVDAWLTPSVARYIDEHDLYR